ncbi:MAG: hypothetical protein J0L94_11255 [Rhodothermia bacterium]|nr:hypothetical protein [Rhodothermia bacterium]
MQTTRAFLTPTLLLLLVIQGLVPLWVQLDFVRRQDYIRKVLCINRNKPGMQCNGKCYLRLRLQKTDQDQQKQQEKGSVEQQLVGLVYVAPLNDPSLRLDGSTPKKVLLCKDDHPLKGIPVEIDHPPNLFA